jgi:hypothetical protein
MANMESSVIATKSAAHELESKIVDRTMMNLREFKLRWAMKKMVRKLHGLAVP